MGGTIGLKEFYRILRKRLALIVTMAFVATIISGVVSHFFITPTYRVSTGLVVNSSNGDNQVNSTDIQSSLQLINTYSDILASPAILDMVIENLNLNITAEQLQGQMSVSNSSNSQVITLSVIGEDPYLARDIANTTAQVFQEEIGNIMNVDNVSILARAIVPGGPISPRPNLNMAVALVVGGMAGIGVSFLLDYLDKTVKTERDIEQALAVPVLGSIPLMKEEDMSGNHRKAGRSKVMEVSA